MKKKMKYTAPEIDCVYVQGETNILFESRTSTSGNPDDSGEPIVEGDPKEGVHLAKPHLNWGEDANDMPAGSGNLW